MSSSSSYSIAHLKALLSQRVGLDLSPIELAEILWLALQQGAVVPEALEERRSPRPFTHESEPEPEPPASSPAANSSSPAESIPVVAEPPEIPASNTAAESDQIAGPALPINIPETVALQNRQAIARSLRPLMRKVASKQRWALDEEATVIQIAETQTWSPVVKPEPERWLELAIVIEVTNLLDVWQDTIAEFQQLMERHGAFRNVRTWQLKPSAEGEPQLFLQTSSGLRGRPRSLRELLDASGRRQILLLSDCTSRAWRTGKIPKLLQLWSRENPVAIVQLLPEHYWDRSALKSSYPVALKSNRPGALSRDWSIEGLSSRRRQQLPEGLKLPVITLQPESLGQWAAAIAAIHDQPTTGILFNPQEFPTPPATTSATPLTAKQLVQRFRNTASAQAQELADMMAVLPVNWSVIRLLQKNLIQEEPWQQTGALHLAEIFLSGLLQPASGTTRQSRHQKTPQYDFVEGVRDALLGTIPISEAWAVGEEVAAAVFKQLPTEVQERVNFDIERRYGDSLSYFEAFLIPDLPWGDSAAAEIFPFAQVTRQVLQRWGGAYAELAETIGSHFPEPVSSQIEITPDFALATFQQQQEEILNQITEAFSDQDHEFELTQDPREQVDAVDEIKLAPDRQLYAAITQHTLRSIESDAEGTDALFELTVRIGFAVRVYYIDFDNFHPEIDDDSPRFEDLVLHQTVDAIAEINLWFSEQNPTEVEIEFLDLRVEQPIHIDETRRDSLAPIPIPPLQTFEFEVATIEVEQPISETVTTGSELFSVSLTPFEFEFATLVSQQESQGQQASQLNIIRIKNIAETGADEIFDAVFETNRTTSRQGLSGLRRDIFRGAWEGQTYKEIASSLGYNEDYISEQGALLFKQLRKELGEGVTKANFRAVLERWLAHRGSEGGEVFTVEQQLRFDARNNIDEIGADEIFDAVFETNRATSRQGLSSLRRKIFRGAWEGQTYKEIASSLEYNEDYVKEQGALLFTQLREELGEEVTKANFRSALERWLTRYRSERGEAFAVERRRGHTQQFIEYLGNDVALEMVIIPGGTFLMGSPPDELERYDSEGPQHAVTVPPFLMGKYPITQHQWRAVAALPQVNRPLEPDPSSFKGVNRPVEDVSWSDAVEFCDRLSRHLGKPYRLPTEAEWEYACRANPVARAGQFRAGDAVGHGTLTPFHFGETVTTDLANYNGEYIYDQGPKGIYREETTPVGSFPANTFGLFDMHGNVWEWCLDHWHDNYEGAPTDGSAWATGGDNFYLMRGGSWLSKPRDCRSACRNSSLPNYHDGSIGFRVVYAATRTLA